MTKSSFIFIAHNASFFSKSRHFSKHLRKHQKISLLFGLYKMNYNSRELCKYLIWFIIAICATSNSNFRSIGKKLWSKRIKKENSSLTKEFIGLNLKDKRQSWMILIALFSQAIKMKHPQKSDNQKRCPSQHLKKTMKKIHAKTSML